MSESDTDKTVTGGREQSGRSIVMVLWYGSMAIAGLGFGSIGDSRPFGNNLLFRPLLMFFIAAAAALVTLRVVAARPVPEIIPDRALGIGCVIGLTMFLAGNFFVTHVLVH